MIRRLLALCFAIGIVGSVGAQPTYSYSEPFGVNNNDMQFVYWQSIPAISRHGKYMILSSDTTPDVYLYSTAPGFTPIDLYTSLPKASFLSVNDNGDVIATLNKKQYIYSLAGNSWSIYNPLSNSNYRTVSPTLINSKGNVAGTEATTIGGLDRAFRWSNGVSKVIFTGPEGSNVYAETTDLGNDDCQVGFTGSSNSNDLSAFMYKEGTPTILNIPGYQQVAFTTVNDNDEAGGYAWQGNSFSGFYYSGGVITILPVYVQQISNDGRAYGFGVHFYPFVCVNGVPYNAQQYIPSNIVAEAVGGIQGVVFSYMDLDGRLWGYWEGRPTQQLAQPVHTFVLTPTN